MTDQTTADYGRDNAPKEKLGVLRILSESFSLLFRNILLLAGIMIVVFLVSMIPYIAMFGSFGEYMRVASRGFAGMSLPVIIFNTIVGVVLYGGLISVLSQLTYDLRMGQRATFMSYLAKAPRHMIPIVLLTLVGFVLAAVPIGLASGISSVVPISGFLFLPLGFVAFLYLMAMFSVTNPAIVVDSSGFRGLGQSMARTKGYRWSIIGVLLLFFIIFMVVAGGLGAILGFASSGFAQTLQTGQLTTAMIVFQVVNMLISALITPLMCIIPVVIFARLKEIKEGYGHGDVGNVFD